MKGAAQGARTKIPLKIIGDFVLETNRRIHLPFHQLFLQSIAGYFAQRLITYTIIIEKNNNQKRSILIIRPSRCANIYAQREKHNEKDLARSAGGAGHSFIETISEIHRRRWLEKVRDPRGVDDDEEEDDDTAHKN